MHNKDATSHIFVSQDDYRRTTLKTRSIACLQIFVGFLAAINSFGFLTSFGVFQIYYPELLHTSASKVSWIGSTPIFVVSIASIISGRLVDTGHFRVAVIVGACLQVVGVFSASAAKGYWPVFVTQGIIMGLGSGLAYTPCIWVVATHFERRKMLAIAISSTGVPVGALMFIGVSKAIIPSYGIGPYLRGIGYILTATNVFIILAARPYQASEKPLPSPLVDFSAFKRLDFALFVAGASFNFLVSCFVPFYIPSFDKSALHHSTASNFNALLLFNACGIIGCILMSWLAEQILGPLPAFTVCILFNASATFGWLIVDSETALWTFAAYYGFFWHAMYALFIPAAASVILKRNGLGARMATCTAVTSIPILMGPPIGGAIVEGFGGGYAVAQLYAGTMYAIAAGLVGAAWYVQDATRAADDKRKIGVRRFLMRTFSRDVGRDGS
ncbi:MFS general substrate transporter [Lophium mytilinum]|uniref:MFS general substrate transporter n=1 Tax=Lophium mytilinum TaxID=390894 RepID=A0A6A6QR05_9PEZI|nr:MFS general substrate transporter [Lophium mytilinum]